MCYIVEIAKNVILVCFILKGMKTKYQINHLDDQACFSYFLSLTSEKSFKYCTEFRSYPFEVGVFVFILPLDILFNKEKLKP